MIDKAIQWLRDLRSHKPFLYHLLIIGFFVLLTAIMTYPVIINLTGSIAGSGDAFQALYILWYTKQALLAGSPNITLGYTNYLFYPNGVPMILTAFSFFDQLLSVPLQILIGLIPTFNLLWLLSFILAGYGMFLLVRYLTGNDPAAVVSGIIFAFCPYHMVQAIGHLGATTIEWIPFSALFLIKMYREPSLKNALLAGIFFIMVAISDSQYMMYMAFFVAILFLYELARVIQQSDRVKALKNIILTNIIFSCVALAALIPLNYDLIRIALSHTNFMQTDIGTSALFSQDLLGFIVPSSLHPLYGGWLAQNFYVNQTGIVESTGFAGYTALVLAFIALVWAYRKREVIFWGISAVFFAVMSLGPQLHINGSITPTFFTMPYALAFQYVPFLSNSSDPGRQDILAMLSLAVLAGYGLAVLMDRFGGLNLKWPGNTAMSMAIAGIIAILVIFEFLSVPTISQVVTPAIYESIGKEPGQFAILEIPASANYAAGIMIEYYDSVDGKQMVGGQLPRIPADASDFEADTPLINYLTDPNYTGFLTSDMFNQSLASVGNYILNYYNIRYVILHPNYEYDGSTSSDMALLNSTLNSGPIYEDNDLVVYRVENVSPVMFMTMGPGWGYTVQMLNATWRWMEGSSASINIISPNAGQFNLSFDVMSNENTVLNVTMNNQLLSNVQVTGATKHETIPVRLQPGENTVYFSTPPISAVNYGQVLYPNPLLSNVSVEPSG